MMSGKLPQEFSIIQLAAKPDETKENLIVNSSVKVWVIIFLYPNDRCSCHRNSVTHFVEHDKISVKDTIGN